MPFVFLLADLIKSLRAAWDDQLLHKIYLLPVCLGGGIALFFAWPSEPGIMMPTFVVTFFFCLTFGLHALHVQTGRFLWMFLLSLMLLMGAGGFTAAAVRTHLIATPMLTEPVGPTGVRGVITSLEQVEGGRGRRVILTDVWIRGLARADQPQRVRLTIRKGGEALKVGQKISAFAKMDPPSPPAVPGGFDFRRDAFFKQIGGYGYVLGTPRVIKDGAGSDGLFFIFENMRNSIAAQVQSAVPARQVGMVSALMTGERAAINKDDWQALRDSGLAHLLAISGANVDMVAMIVFFLVRLALAALPRVALYYPIKKWAAVAAFIAAIFYVLLILPSVPTLRALLTISIVLIAILVDRNPISLRLVAVVASLVLIIMPEQVMSPSFQLSFAAVTALVAVFEILGPWLYRAHRDLGPVWRLVMYIAGVCGTTIIATLATAPISLYHFQNLALYGVLANALAVPIMTFLIMPLSIACYVLIPLGAASGALVILGAMNEWILTIAHVTASLPGARLSPPAMPFDAFLMIIIAGLILTLAIRHLKYLAVFPLLAAVFLTLTHVYPSAAILGGGKVVMMRAADGTVLTTTKRYARRQQGDWARYWGADSFRVKEEGDDILPSWVAQVPRDPTHPVAIWRDASGATRWQVVGQSQGRLWSLPGLASSVQK